MWRKSINIFVHNVRYILISELSVLVNYKRIGDHELTG